MIMPFSPKEKESTHAFDWVLPGDSTQERVYEELGHRMVEGIADGFHGCALAYGQTSSGKSHTIFGARDEGRGLLPRLAEGLFQELERSTTDYLVKVSYLEIYNENVRDLLTPGGAISGSPSPSLEIRQHPEIGVFVEGLTHNVADSHEDVGRLLDFGHKIRVVGATNLNAASSRSHAVVTLHVETASTEDGCRRVRRAQLHAVDLAGSERLETVGALEERRKESKEINKSLSALSLMISRLSRKGQRARRTSESLPGSLAGSSNSIHQQQPQQQFQEHIPYRNSKLTHLLSEALMGNCRTLLLACVSPAESALPMTLSTLQFASSAKRIKTRPVKNEDVDGCLVEQLRAEIESLRELLGQMGGDHKQEVARQLATAQLAHAQLSPTKEELQAQSQAFERRLTQFLANLGVSGKQVADAAAKGEMLPVREDAHPFLVKVCDDPLLSGRLVYSLPPGRTARVGSDPSCDIRLEGRGIQREMCGLTSIDGSTVILTVPREEDTPRNGTPAETPRWHLESGQSRRKKVLVNGQSVVEEELHLASRDKLRIGPHSFLLTIPQAHNEQDGRNVSTILSKMAQRSKTDDESRLAQEYATHLRERIGKDRTIRILTDLEKLQEQVEEANELTEDLRGGEEFEWEFQAQVMMEVASAEYDPDIVVALYTRERPEEVGPKGEWVYQSGGCGKRVLRSIFSKEQFKRRLEVLRDTFDVVNAREEPWGKPEDLNPWSIHDQVSRVQTLRPNVPRSRGQTLVTESAFLAVRRPSETLTCDLESSFAPSEASSGSRRPSVDQSQSNQSTTLPSKEARRNSELPCTVVSVKVPDEPEPPVARGGRRPSELASTGELIPFSNHPSVKTSATMAASPCRVPPAGYAR